MPEAFYVSRKKYEALVNELKDLKELKAQLSNEIGEAAAQGDLKENAEYHAAKEKQAETLIRIQELESRLRNAQITDDLTVDKSEARIGATVTFQDVDAGLEFTYTLVGSMEANPEKGLLSVQSPLANGVLGKKEGDTFEAQLPRGPKTYKLIKLEYK
ncbi:MAG: transcription elongation factor GreA [Candidatus Avelusimicrobium sp.]|uniref:GreA/GreB family elongation factor n=1 Tax=Candidatus Avelusimicrobium sp. TaxID=3048833 RepID=UPI003F087B34